MSQGVYLFSEAEVACENEKSIVAESE